MTTTPAALAAQLGIAPIKPWCRDKTCTESTLDWALVDREDGSGLHVGCVEILAPAVVAGPTEAQAVANLVAAGAELISSPAQDVTERLAEAYNRLAGTYSAALDAAVLGVPAGPCMDAWCTKNGNPCGFDVAAHINAHGPSILTNPDSGPDKPIPATKYAPEQNGGQPYLIPAAGTVLAAQQTAPAPAAAPTPAAFVSPAQPVPGSFTAPATLPGDSPLKVEMMRIIRWYDGSRPRSLQRAIGMSEVGVECLRRLAYSALEVPQANAVKDPWFAIVGTSVHAWLADALVTWNNEPNNMGPVFQVEQRVTASDGTVAVSGSTDFYRNALVGDHKVVGSTALKKYRDHGPSGQYRTQVHINGLGWEQAGFPVDTVALLFYPRSGYLDHMHVWSEPYNRQVALDALGRLGSVRTTASLLGPAALPPTPDKAGCVWCPFYNPNLTAADGTGCPGR